MPNWSLTLVERAQAASKNVANCQPMASIACRLESRARPLKESASRVQTRLSGAESETNGVQADELKEKSLKKPVCNAA